MNSESLKEAVNRLVGDITPEGETLHDEQALANLHTARPMIAGLVSDLCSNARSRNEYECSVGMIGLASYNLLTDLVLNNFDVFEEIVEMEKESEKGEE